ncbi:hypothetical protein V8B97DRAFT_1980956 [Scleroderma yunnanense]
MLLPFSASKLIKLDVIVNVLLPAFHTLQDTPFQIHNEVQLPLLSSGHPISPYHQLIAHGVGCILVFEYAYFYLQEKEVAGDLKETFALAVREYQKSGTQDAVQRALQVAIKECKEDKDKGTKIITDLVVKHRMSKKLLKSAQ